MADSERFELRVSPELLELMDEARGDLSRSTWAKVALRRAAESDVETFASVDGPAVENLDREAAVLQASESPELRGLGDLVAARDEAPPVVPVFKCRSCEFSAPSEGARCPLHSGRLVKVS